MPETWLILKYTEDLLFISNDNIFLIYTTFIPISAYNSGVVVFVHVSDEKLENIHPG